MIERNALDRHLDSLLEVSRFKDYGPNGLQVEGKPTIRKIVSGVTASMDLIQAAIHSQADAIIVHHGLFWRGQDGRLTGWMKKRVAALMAHDIKRLGLAADLRFGEQDLGCIGDAPEGLELQGLSQMLTESLGRVPTVVPGDGRAIKRIAWCSGGAQSYFEAAIAAGADAFMTGEISEPQAHYARETGVAYLACGHHASERYGAQALGKKVAHDFALEHEFIDIDNPA